MGRRAARGGLTPLELELMQVLWRTGPARVQDVRAGLSRELAYTTVQTMLNVLFDKGKVKRTLRDRVYVYRPAVTWEKEAKSLVGDLVDRLFSGSAESLVMSLMENRQLSPEAMSRLAAQADAMDDDDGR